MEELKYPYAKQSIDASDKERVAKSLEGAMITRGDHLRQFEEEVAKYTGARFAVAFNSCSTALAASFFAVNVSSGDRVITTPNTFVASCGYACHAGAQAIFVDIERKTGNIDVERLSFNLEPLPSRGKNIIVPVHFSGIPVDMRHLESYIKDLNTVVIEDAAHALGSSYKDGSKVGSCAYSHITCFSFHPAKTITTGEGGMCTTNHEPLYRRLLDYRNNGIERDPSRGPWVYDVNYFTGNFWMNEMQAALGLSQLARLPKFIEKRKKLVNRYRELLANQEGIELFTPDSSLDIAWHIFVVQIDFPKFNKTRTEVMEALKERSIGTQVHYIPLYRHPVFAKGSGDISSYFPEMEAYYAKALTLPLYYDLELKDVDYVVGALLEILKK